MKYDKKDKIQPNFNENDIILTEDLHSESSSHSKIYNKEIYIYSWGKNKYGELGLNTAKNTFIPSPIKTLKQTIIKSVKSGGRNTIILTSDGQVLMCGSNIFNLLAINTKFQNNEQYQKTFKNIKFFEENNETIKEIAVAEFHSMALTNNGEIYGWGGNLYNKLGQTNGLCGLPSKIYIKRKIISISCGDHHSCALSENGVLYSWGGGGESYNKGQCGHGTKKDIEYPKKIEFFTKKGLHVIKVSCGGYHTIAMDENYQLYGFGKGIFGQCGYGKGEDTDTPQKIIFNDNVNKIIDIKCGGEHTIFLSNNGRVYACGHGYYGQLGLGNNKNVKAPILVHSLSNKNVLEIAAGWSHTLVLTDENNVYAAGCGKFGELGLGEDTNRYNYTWLRKLGDMNIKHIFAGGHHSWCIVDDKNPLKDKFVEPEPLEKPNYKMPKRKLSEDSNRNNLSFNDTINPRNKGSNTVDYGKRRDPYKDGNDSFDKNKKTMNNLNVIDNKDLKRMIDDYNDDKNNSLNNIDNIIDYFDNINTPDSMKKKIKYDNINNNNDEDNNNNNNNNDIDNDNANKKINDFDDDNNKQPFSNLDDIKNKSDNNYNSGKDSSPYINDQNNYPSENSFENKINKIADEDNYLNNSRNNNNKKNNLDNENNDDDDYIRNNLNTDNINNNDNNKNNEFNNSKGNYNQKMPSDNYHPNNSNKNFDPYNKYNRYNSNSSRGNNNINKNDSNSNFNDFSNSNQNKKSGKIPYNNSNYNYNNNDNYNYNNSYNNNYPKNRNDFSNNTLSYLNQLNQNRIKLQLIYTELNLSHRFIRFEISNTNKYYKLDYKSINNMIRKYLSLDKGNISFYLQDDREAVKGGKKPINPMMDNLMKEMLNTGLFNSERNKVSYTIAIVYDYNKNEMLGKFYEEMKENQNGKSISFLNFRIIDENQILNDPNGIEGALSKWTIDFFEQFKELFIVYEDDISGVNYGVSNERIIRPRFLEMRPKIFK